jgi:DNA-binding transcriptional regulator YiaG
MINAETSPFDSDSYFARRLKELRLRIVGKQACLSYAVGCTDAAVSFWESGKRLPHQGMISRILLALAESGASASELSSLLHTWRKERTGRGARAA